MILPGNIDPAYLVALGFALMWMLGVISSLIGWVVKTFAGGGRDIEI